MLAPLTRSGRQLDTAQAGIRAETTIQCSFSSHTRARRKKTVKHANPSADQEKKNKRGEAQSCPCETISARAVNKLHHHRPSGRRKRLVKHLHRRLHMVRGHECWSLAALSTLLHTRQCSFTGVRPLPARRRTHYVHGAHARGGRRLLPSPRSPWRVLEGCCESRPLGTCSPPLLALPSPPAVGSVERDYVWSGAGLVSKSCGI